MHVVRFSQAPLSALFRLAKFDAWRSLVLYSSCQTAFLRAERCVTLLKQKNVSTLTSQSSFTCQNLTGSPSASTGSKVALADEASYMQMVLRGCVRARSVKDGKLRLPGQVGIHRTCASCAARSRSPNYRSRTGNSFLHYRQIVSAPNSLSSTYKIFLSDTFYIEELELHTFTCKSIYLVEYIVWVHWNGSTNHFCHFYLDQNLLHTLPAILGK